MVRKKIEFTMIKDKSRLRSTRNKRLVGLLKKEMKLNRLTAMPFASFYFVDDQLVRIASADPDFMIQKVLNHIRSGKSVQTLTPDDLEKLTNNELKIGVRRGNRGPYFSEDCKTSQAHLSHEEQMIAMQTANNLRAAAEGSIHGMASGGRQRGMSEASSSQSSNRDDDPEEMSENDEADDHHRRKSVTIKQDPNLGGGSGSLLNSSGAGGGGMPSAMSSSASNSTPLALAASNLLSGLPMTTGMGPPMSEEDRKNSAIAQELMRHTGSGGGGANPAGGGPPSSSSSSGNHGVHMPINYHLHQHLLLNNAGGGSRSSSSAGRKRPRDGSDEYNVAMSQIEDRMTKEGMMIKEDPNAVQQPHQQQIAGVPTVPPTLAFMYKARNSRLPDLASLMQSIGNHGAGGGGAGAPTIDLSNTSSALSHLLASAGGSGGNITDKFTALASSILAGGAGGPSSHAPLPHGSPQPPPPGAPGGSMSGATAAELFSTNFSHAQMPPPSSSIQPPSSSSLGAPHPHPPPRGSADMNFASKLKVASSFLANDAISPPVGPPPPGAGGSSSGGGASRRNLDMMSVLK